MKTVIKVIEVLCVTGGICIAIYSTLAMLKDPDKWYVRLRNLRDNHRFMFFLGGSDSRSLDDKETWLPLFRRQQRLLLIGYIILWIALVTGIVLDI